MEDAKQEEKLMSILMFPWLAHGHIYPFFELAKRLSTRNFKIYICSTPINIGSINAKEASSSSSSSSIELVELHMPSSPELPPHMHTTKNLPSQLIPKLIQAFQDSSTSFVQILNAIKPDLVIYDIFQPWAPKLAWSQGIPAVYLGVSGSASIAYYHHLHTTTEKDSHSSYIFPSQTVYLLDHEIVDLKDRIAPYLKDADVEYPWFGNLARSSEIVLTKSCRVVEEKYADYLSDLCKKEVVTTGPLVCDHGSDHSADGDDPAILKWLSGKDPFSTLYISFGSEHFLSEQEIGEIAKGLELCSDGVNFIWIIRFAGDALISSLNQVLPQSFLDNTKERGMVITGWAPQQKILAHPSVGGFLSHCGTNAIAEALYYGVPVIAMPLKYDHPLLARLLVEAGFATEVVGKPAESKGIHACYRGEEIAKSINKVFVEKESGEAMRKRAQELSLQVTETEEDEVSYLAVKLTKLCIKYQQIRRH